MEKQRCYLGFELWGLKTGTLLSIFKQNKVLWYYHVNVRKPRTATDFLKLFFMHCYLVITTYYLDITKIVFS